MSFERYALLWLRAFVVTTGVELAVAMVLLRGAMPARARRAALVFFANLLSHPAVWFFWAMLVPNRTRYLVVAEAWAVASEALFYQAALERVDARRAWATALAANAASFGAGLALRVLGFDV